MKILTFCLFLFTIALTGFKPYAQEDHIEFSCFRMHKASNTCHFNFTVDGAKFRYVDMGCKYQKKHAEAIKKVKDGTLALARDWKISCGDEPKEKKDSGF